MKATILITLLCATVLMRWPQTPPIPQSTIWKTGVEMQETTCQRLLKDHHWKYSSLRLNLNTNNMSHWLTNAEWHRLHYCTNCGLLRIEP